MAAEAAQAAADYVQNFEWLPGVTPLSRPGIMLTAVAGYLVTIFGIKAAVRRPVPVPAWVAGGHNLVLCVWSLAMFLGCGWECVRLVAERGALGAYLWLMCIPVGTRVQGGLWFWSYVYYLSKYYELLDTVLLALKAKPLTFLHVSHHALVLPMSYLWVHAAQSTHPLGLLFNTGIHVVMYYYYYRCCVGRPPPWKRLITYAQLVQFMFSFAVTLPFWYTVAASPLPPAATCSGWHAMLFNAAFNVMLLGLFLNFSRATYGARKHKAA